MLRKAVTDGVLLGGKEEEWCGSHTPEYVKRIDRTPIQTTTNHKLALLMGRFTAEDAVKSIHNSQCSPELVPVG